jgi:glycerol kinase
MAKNTYGTGCFLLLNTGREAVASRSGMLTTVSWRLGGEVTYALEGSVFVGGALFQWLRDELQVVSSAQEVDELAATVPDSGGCVLVPAFAGLGAPHWDPLARGSLFGVTRGTSKAHLCRAALEAVALQSAELLECMERDSGVALNELRVDGGAARSDLLMQIQADLLRCEVVRPRNIETTALGAAALAGLATGVWRNCEEFRAGWSEDRRFAPGEMPPAEMRRLWNRAVERTKGWEEAVDSGQ